LPGPFPFLGDLEIVMNRAARFFLGLTVVGFLAAMTALPGDKRTSGERVATGAFDPSAPSEARSKQVDTWITAAPNAKLETASER
jgi:hypothetical protein